MSATIGFCLLRDWFGMLAHRTGVGVHPFDGPGQVLTELADGNTRSIGDLVYGVRWVLEDMTADQPVLLVVDDIQWADESSLQALDLLVNAVQNLPCLIVYAVRPGEQVSSPETLRRLMQASRVLTPKPLSRVAVSEAVLAEHPDATQDDIDELHRLSGGIPFYLHELLADGTSGTPEAVIGAVTGRLERLGESATITARAVCVLGRQATVGPVAELSGLSLDIVADDITALVESQLLMLENGVLTARHPLMGDAILARLSATENSALHERAAQILAGRGASRPVIASYLLSTMPADNPDVRNRLREQGENALQGRALDMAAKFLVRAVAEGALSADDVDLLSATARSLAGLNRLDEALSYWDRAADLTKDPEVLARLRSEAGDALVTAGRHRDAQVAFGALFADDSAPGPARQRLAARMVLAGLLNGVSLVNLRQQVDGVLGQDVDKNRDRLSLAAESVLLTFECRDSDLVRSMALRSVGGGALLEDTSEGSSLYLATGSLSWTSAYVEAEALLTSAIDDAESRGSSMAFATASACRGAVRTRMGMISEAIVDLEAALAHRSKGWKAYLAHTLASLVECRIARGELDLASAHREELQALSHSPGMTGSFATYALADLAAAHSEHDRAAHLYAEVGRMVEGRMDNPAILAWRAGESLARIRLGSNREAIDLARENAVLARQFGAPYAVAQALRTLAAVDPTGDRVALLREALASLRGTRAPRLEAQIATDLAGMLVLTRSGLDGGEVVELLRRAESYSGFQELRPLSERVQRLLERVGEPVMRSTAEAVSTLTASERRVADLAASGLSNRQIAQQLFVTVKAVEWHLSNVYRKLGIRSRTRLPSVLTSSAANPGSELPGGRPMAQVVRLNLGA